MLPGVRQDLGLHVLEIRERLLDREQRLLRLRLQLVGHHTPASRSRPTTALVPQVTEHPGASSYPSGHTIFIVTVTTVLMLCFGYRFLPRRALPVGWILVALIVFANAIGRIYTGAHWPSDVLGGLLIAVAWMSLLLSVRWVSDRVRRQA